MRSHMRQRKRQRSSPFANPAQKVAASTTSCTQSYLALHLRNWQKSSSSSCSTKCCRHRESAPTRTMWCPCTVKPFPKQSSSPARREHSDEHKAPIPIAKEACSTKDDSNCYVFLCSEGPVYFLKTPDLMVNRHT